VVLIALALACAAIAWWVHDAGSVPIANWLRAWERAHPDPRVFSEAEADQFAALQDSGRRDDLRLLLIGLAAGCAVAAFSARAVRAAGGTLRATLLGGAVAVGCVGVVFSLRGQWQASRTGEWTLGDDALVGMAGVHAETLRGWRERIAEDHAVILIGTDSLLSNVTAWALHPRAVYPLVRGVPDGTPDAELREAVTLMRLGAEHDARWIVDLAALAAGPEAARSALLRVDP
jgi:hypothetical protein